MSVLNLTYLRKIASKFHIWGCSILHAKVIIKSCEIHFDGKIFFHRSQKCKIFELKYLWTSYKSFFFGGKKMQISCQTLFTKSEISEMAGKFKFFAWIGVDKFFFANIIADIWYRSKVIKGKRCKKSLSKTFASKTFSNFDSFSCKLRKPKIRLHKYFP